METTGGGFTVLCKVSICIVFISRIVVHVYSSHFCEIHQTRNHKAHCFTKHFNLGSMSSTAGYVKILACNLYHAYTCTVDSEIFACLFFANFLFPNYSRFFKFACGFLNNFNS